MALITSQTGIRSVTKMYEDVELFKGILKMDDKNIAQFDPMIGGYGTFWWLKMPPFMTQYAADLTKRFKNLTEKGHTGIDGINDMTANTEDITGGIAGNSFKVVSNIKDDFDELTIKCYEMQGSPLREALECWLTGIRDPKTGYATYHGLVDTIDGGYCAKNHTAEMLYVVTDPSGSHNGIEYACLICNMIPTKIPKSHLNITHGDHGTVQFDISFTGVKYESAAINEYAKNYLQKKRMIETYLDFKAENLPKDQ